MNWELGIRDWGLGIGKYGMGQGVRINRKNDPYEKKQPRINTDKHGFHRYKTEIFSIPGVKMSSIYGNSLHAYALWDEASYLIVALIFSQWPLSRASA